MAAAPRAKRRRTYHHGDLESALLDASTELIATMGVDAFTLREVARRVGVNHAAAYRHFADKNMLLEAIAARGYAELAERLDEACHACRVRTSRAASRASRSPNVRFAVEQEPRFRVMTRPRREELRSPALESALDRALGVLLSVANDGVESGALTDVPPVDHALRVYVFAYGFATLYLLGRLRVRPAATESYLRSLIAPLVASLCAR
jgi:AcrR family transcriptional regulator